MLQHQPHRCYGTLALGCTGTAADWCSSAAASLQEYKSSLVQQGGGCTDDMLPLLVLDQVEVLQCGQDIVHLDAGCLAQLLDGDGGGVGPQDLQMQQRCITGDVVLA